MDLAIASSPEAVHADLQPRASSQVQTPVHLNGHPTIGTAVGPSSTSVGYNMNGVMVQYPQGGYAQPQAQVYPQYHLAQDQQYIQAYQQAQPPVLAYPQPRSQPGQPVATINGHVPYHGAGTQRGRGRGRGRGAANAVVAGVGRGRPLTPPFVYVQRAGDTGLVDSPVSSDSEPLPANHIHIVQTTPRAAHSHVPPHGTPHQGPTHPTSSTLSTGPVPPAQSNGPSSDHGTPTHAEMYQTPPRQMIARPQAGAKLVTPQVHSSVRVIEPATGPVTLPKDQLTYSDTISADETLAVLRAWADGLSDMEGGTFSEWSAFVDDWFEEGARMQLILIADEVKMFDIPSTSSARLFMALSIPEETHASGEGAIPSRIVVTPADATLNPDSYDVAWYMADRTWTGSIAADVAADVASNESTGVRRGKITRMELVLDTGDKGIPDGVMRVLEISQTMQHLSSVMEIMEKDRLDPREAYKRLAAQP